MVSYQSEGSDRDVGAIETVLNSIQASLELLSNTVNSAEKVFSPVLIPAPPSPRDDEKTEVIGSTITQRLRSFNFQIDSLGGRLEELINRSEL